MHHITFVTRGLRISLPKQDVQFGSAFEPQSFALRTTHARIFIEDPSSSKSEIKDQIVQGLNAPEDTTIELGDSARIDILSDSKDPE